MRRILALASGLVLSLAYPGWNVEPTVWLWMLPLLAALWLPGRRPLRPRAAFGLGWLAGFAFFFSSLRWLRDIHGGGVALSFLGWSLLASYLALFFGLWALFAATLGRPDPKWFRPAAAGAPLPAVSHPALRCLGLAAANAAVWCGVEWLRGWLMGGFGWNGLGVAFHDNPTIMQVAEWTGVTGLAFLPAFAACALFTTGWRFVARTRHPGLRLGFNFDFFAAALLLILGMVTGANRLSALGPEQRQATPVRAAVVQRNIPQDTKWEPRLALAHTRSYLDAFQIAMEARAASQVEEVARQLRDEGQASVDLFPLDLVLLPEAAIPFYLHDPITTEFAQSMLEAAGAGTALVTGINDMHPGEPPRYYNTIAVFDRSPGAITSYRKVNLVPFGEYLPFRWFPPIQWIAGAAVPGDLTPGSTADPLTLEGPDPPLDLLPLICFEDTLGRHARRFIRKGRRQILVNTTNDGWFNDPAAALQHAANAKFRCVELRRPMLRAANTGLTCAIDLTGSTLDPLDPDGRDQRLLSPDGSPQVADILFAHLLPLDRGPVTFHARFGDTFTVAAAVAALAGAWLLRRRATILGDAPSWQPK